MLGRVRQYLTRRRSLPTSLIEPLVESGKLYADSRGNAVFLLVSGKANRPVGAELRGAGPCVWRGMAPRTRKDVGYFWVGAEGSQEIVLCESAIDAMSCLHIYPQHICISTSGVRANPPWLKGLIARGYEIHRGFDADGPGDATAARMIAIHPAVQRLRPSTRDWNDALTSGHKQPTFRPENAANTHSDPLTAPHAVSRWVSLSEYRGSIYLSGVAHFLVP